MTGVARQIRAVFFDVGETLIDESRAWAIEAERAGVSPLTVFAALGALIERGEDHRRLWQMLGIERNPGGPPRLQGADLYPDARGCLERLRADGYLIGVAGNQPEGAVEALDEIGLPVDVVASSARWGVAKPQQQFFERISAAANVNAQHIAYVGDRLDHDVLPARRAGMFAIFIRRGPWGHIHAHRPEVAQADARVMSLSEIPAVLSPLAED